MNGYDIDDLNDAKNIYDIIKNMDECQQIGVALIIDALKMFKKENGAINHRSLSDLLSRFFGEIP